MTTDSDLRDLLSSEAAGPPQPAPGWDDVMRRGRHRRRTRRAQTVIVGGLAAALVVAFVRSDQDQGLETTPPATQPSAPRSSVDIPEPDPPGSDIASARVEGAFVTLIIGGGDARGPEAADVDPCDEYHPLVIESPTQVIIDVVDATVEEGTSWAHCSGRAGKVELAEPLGQRELIDGRAGDILGPVEVQTSAGLLFPTVLPEPFVLDEWDEWGGRGTWTFHWIEGDRYLNVVNGHDGGDWCDPVDVEVRGTSGRLCYDESDGRFELLWEEVGDGNRIAMVGNLGSRPTSETIDDVVAVAEGLVGLENDF